MAANLKQDPQPDSGAPTLAAGPATFEAQAPLRSASPKKLMNHQSTPPWVYLYHPLRWSLYEDEWLPHLAEHRVDPGLNATDKSGDSSLGLVDAMQDDWTVIPETVIGRIYPTPPDGIASYVRRYDGVAGPVHLSIWQRPTQIGNSVHVESDREGYKAFLRALAMSGLFPRPPQYVFDRFISAQRERVGNIPTDNDKGKAARDREQALLDRMIAADIPNKVV